MYDDRPSPLVHALVLVLAAAALYALAPALADFWHMDEPPGPVLALLCAYAVLGARWRLAYLLALPVAGGLAYWAPWVAQGLWLDFTVWYTDLLLWQWPAPAGFLAWAVLAGLLCLLGVLFVREPLRRGTAFWSAAAGILLLGHMWLWGGDLAARQYGLFLLAVCLLWAAGGAAWREQRWHQAGRRVVDSYRILEPMAIVGVLVGLCAWVIPAPARGLELGAVTAWARATFPALEQMRGGADQSNREPQGFNLTTAGFARRLSELGGPVKLDEALAMKVWVLKGPTNNTIYLRGTAMTNYTGRGWVADTRPGDTGADSPSAGPQVVLEIEHVGLRGATLFYPRELGSVEGAEIRFGREGHVLTAAALDGPYRLTAYLPAGRPTGFQPPEYDPGRYLALPRGLPQRVRDLAKDLTRESRSPYEAALAIEAYLRAMPYTLDVPATPPGRDFADYFLFDLKRGYCTYSATAMAVMLRSQGIPSRWVQGFVLEPGPAVHEVTWGKAHAWVEAYFPGYGWAVFDPTPRFALPARTGETGGDLPVFEPVLAEPTAEAPEPGGTLQGDIKSTRRTLPWIWPGVALLLLAWLATSLRRWHRERIDWRNERTGLVRAYRILTGALRRMGFGPRPGQTPVEYVAGVASTWPEAGRTVDRVSADVTAALYSRPDAPLPPGARRRMGGALAALWPEARRRFGAIRTAWMRLRFLWGKD